MSESTTYTHDVFVSYSEADREWVQNELLPRLRNAGLRVIDQSDFVIGAPKLVNSEQAVDNSRHTLIVMTPDWVASEWAEFEGLLISSKDPAARQRRLIPLLLRPCQLPARIAMLTPADFTNPATREAEMKRLLRSLGVEPDRSAEGPSITPLTAPPPFADHAPPTTAHPTDPALATLASPQKRWRIGIIVMAALAGLMSNVVAGYRVPFFAGRTGLAIAIFLLIFVTGLWLELSDPNQTVNQFTRWLHRLAQRLYIWLDKLPVQQRRLVYVATFVCLGVLIIASVALAQPAPLCPPTKTCILVADFMPLNNETATQFPGQIATEIDNLLNKTATKDFAVERAPAVDDAEGAKQLARKEHALLVVWGRVFQPSSTEKPLISVNFQIADLLGVGEAQGTRPYRAQPLAYQAIGEYCTDCIYVEATQRTNIVAQAVAGLVHYAQGRPEQAHFDFQTALYCAGESLDPETVAILQPTCQPGPPSARWKPGLLYYYAGKALVLQGNYKDAIAFLQQAAQRNAEDPAAWIGIGTAYQSWLAQPNAPEAVKALHQAETVAQNLLGKVKPEMQPVIQYDLGLIYELLKDYPHAQQHYQEAAQRFANVGASAYASLMGLARVQAPDDALQTLEQARKLDETLPWAYLDLARVQRDSQSKAKDLLQRAGEIAPDEAYVDITHADLCLQWKGYACAATAYAQALKKRPDSGWLYSKIGEFYLPTNPVLPQQSWTEAERYFRRAATDLRPQDPWAHERLAYVLFNQQAYAESIQEYQRALDLVYDKSEVAGLYCSLGHAQQRANQVTAANESYERFAKLAPTDEHGRARKICLKN